MALPITNLKLYDVANALGMSLTNISMYAVFNNVSVNGAGLDPTYCAGADATARLTNLRTTPYSLNKFRNYNHSALTALTVSVTTSQNPCGAPSSGQTVYCTHSSLSAAYAGGGYIYTDSSGTTHCSAGKYSDVSGTWYTYSGSAFTAETVCTTLSVVNAVGPFLDTTTACLGGGTPHTYYFDGVQTLPFTGDTVYEDASGTIPASEGYYSANGGDWWMISKYGYVEDHGKC